MKLKTVISNLVEKFHVVESYDKMCLYELVYSVLTEPSNKYDEKLGDRIDWVNLREELFGDAYCSLYERTLGIASSWSNDLEDAFIACVLKTKEPTGTVYNAIFEQLDKMVEDNGQ